MPQNAGFQDVNNVVATLIRGAVLAALAGSVLFVLIPQIIVRMMPLLPGQ